MKNILIAFFCFYAFALQAGPQISLSQQAALHMCSYPSIKEGVIDLLYLTVDDLWHSGAYDRIFPVLRLITMVSPSEVEAWSLGGWFLANAVAPGLSGSERDDVVEQAAEFMKAGLEKNPEHYRLYLELARYYYYRGFLSDALRYLEEGVLYPHPVSMRHLKAHVYMKKGLNEKAVNEWKILKEQYPGMRDIAERFIEKLNVENDY